MRRRRAGENNMMRTDFSWFGLCVGLSVLAYCFLVVAAEVV